MELIKNLRQQIYREFKINPLDHFECTNCGVGINKNEEMINAATMMLFLMSNCRSDQDRHGMSNPLLARVI